jgi:hypothetical protein
LVRSMCRPMPFDPTMCCICFETIVDGEHYLDAEGQKWDVHRGVCAIHAGHVPSTLQAVYDQSIETIHHLTGDAKRDAIRVFYAWPSGSRG